MDVDGGMVMGAGPRATITPQKTLEKHKQPIIHRQHVNNERQVTANIRE